MKVVAISDTIKSGETFDVTGDRGCLKKVLVEGSEIIPPGVTAIIEYTGRLLDGTIFDSSIARGAPFTFKVGSREVILGWDLGVATMKKGEKCRFLLVSEYAYGKERVGPIPPNSTVEYEVELMGWEGKQTEAFALLPLVTMSVFLSLLGCFIGSLFYKL